VRSLGEIVVGMADMKVTGGDNILTTYALGSCVGICLYDEVTGIGGLLHAMLPDSGGSMPFSAPEKYVDSGLTVLYRTLCHMGIHRHHLQAKLIGGAKMFGYKTTVYDGGIGTANVMQAKKLLRKMGIRLVWEVTGGMVGRTIRFRPATGAVLIQSTDHKIEVI